MKYKFFVILFSTLTYFSCISTKKIAVSPSIKSISFINEAILPNDLTFQNTVVGGLSGIDYDKQSDRYYLISDDRSNKNPSRFYEAKIILANDTLYQIEITAVHTLKDSSGNNYPNSLINRAGATDPEALRKNPKKNTLTWSSEGERIISPTDTILTDPYIYEMDKEGTFIHSYELPFQFKMTKTEEGPRRNGVFEGLAFDGKGKHLFASTEEPLIQDGGRAALYDTSGIIRLIKYHTQSRKQVAQYAYVIDPVAFPPNPIDGFRVNGVSDIMWVNTNQLIVVERSFSVGREGCTIKVYLADISQAQDVKGISSLRNLPIRTVRKHLLFNMDHLQMKIENIEGVTWGPLLSNGKRSLIFVADNNFNPLEKTQFLLFSVD